MERFKLAAEHNLGVFFLANARLRPPRGGRVLQYDPKSQAWREPFTGRTSDDDVDLEGPFTYFLSTTTAPRLEPTFEISPLLTRLPPSPSGPPSMDLTILRPLRDPRVQSAGKDGTEAWKPRAKEVLGMAYRAGAHVDLTYPAGGGQAEVRGDGEVVVETFRCGGFIWTPTVRFERGCRC